MIKNNNPASPKTGEGATRERKPLLEHKAVQNIAPLQESKDKFKEWNVKFVNCMGQVDPQYGKALTCLMKWADAEVMPDMESGWPGSSGLFDAVPGLNKNNLTSA